MFRERPAGAGRGGRRGRRGDAQRLAGQVFVVLGLHPLGGGGHGGGEQRIAAAHAQGLPRRERSVAQGVFPRQAGEFIERRRPPPHIRHEVDIGYRVTGQSVEIFEVRPGWDRPTEKIERPIAKATFVRTQNVWRVYWQRADLKWHLYEPVPKVSGLPEFLSAVEQDPHGCFWG